MSIKLIFITMLSLIFLTPVFAGDTKQEEPKQADSEHEAAKQEGAKQEGYEDKAAIAAFMKSPIVTKISESAYGYAIFPGIGKAGFGIGGAYGSGRVFVKGKKTGDVTMTQVSFGFQVGGQAYRQVIYFQDKRAYDDFTSGEFKFSAQAEAIALTASAGVSAGTEGTSASANESQKKSADYFNGMVVFTMGKGGLMYQAALGGQKYNFKALK
jgi:lipid-binding SYLF domain-containing protein